MQQRSANNSKLTTALTYLRFLLCKESIEMNTFTCKTHQLQTLINGGTGSF